MKDLSIYTEALACLDKCVFLPGSYPKRFVRNLATSKPETLSDKQLAYIRHLAWQFRRQIKNAAVIAWASQGKTELILNYMFGSHVIPEKSDQAAAT